MSLLTGLQCFHGTIDTRECHEALAEPGDFLVRNHVKLMDKDPQPAEYVCILTLAVTPDEFPDDLGKTSSDYSFKSQTITRLKSFFIVGKPGSFTFKGYQDTFSSINELLESFQHYKLQLPNGGTLVRAVSRRPWQLLLSDLEFPNPEIFLGKGAFGQVIKAKWLKKEGESIDVAVKSTIEGGHEEKFTEMYKEARTMRRLIHPNIIGCSGIIVEKLPVMLVIEFFDGQCLSDVLQKKMVPDIMRFPVIVGIMYALVHIHSQQYIHRDVAARNVMVSANCRNVKLIDFGLAKHGLIFKLTSNERIPKKWLSPEVLRNWTFSTKSDVWAFAVTVWEIYHDGAVPYSKTQTVQEKKKTQVQTKRRSRSHEKEQDPLKIVENLKFVPNGFMPIFEAMLLKDHKDRIEMAAVAERVERQVFQNLPKGIKEEAEAHMKRRPSFDPNFKMDESLFQQASSESVTDKKPPTPIVKSPAEMPKPVIAVKATTRRNKSRSRDHARK